MLRGTSTQNKIDCPWCPLYDASLCLFMPIALEQWFTHKRGALPTLILTVVPQKEKSSFLILTDGWNRIATSVCLGLKVRSCYSVYGVANLIFSFMVVKNRTSFQQNTWIAIITTNYSLLLWKEVSITRRLGSLSPVSFTQLDYSFIACSLMHR